MDLSAGRHAAAAACILLADGAAPQGVDGYAPPAAGSSFLVERRESGSFGARSEEFLHDVDDVQLGGQKLVGIAALDVLLLYLPAGGLVGVAGRDGALIASWDPPVDFGYPLGVGKRWKQQGTVTFHQQGRTERFETDARVEALEDVEVPAGTFRAYRIRSRGADGADNLDWLCPELGIYVKRLIERGAEHPLGAGKVEILLKWQDIRLR